MAASITRTIALDGTIKIHAATFLFDLLEDFEYFRAEAARLDSAHDPLAYKRCARAAIVSFTSYFDGVLNRWLGKLDPGFRPEDVSIGRKIDLAQRELHLRKGRRINAPDSRRLRGLRNRIVHLNLANDDAKVVEELMSGECFRQAQKLLAWLKVAGHRLGMSLHDQPAEMIQPFLDVYGGQQLNPHPSLPEEDEELVHLAEMTFLELDAQEAADVKP